MWALQEMETKYRTMKVYIFTPVVLFNVSDLLCLTWPSSLYPLFVFLLVQSSTVHKFSTFVDNFHKGGKNSHDSKLSEDNDFFFT